MRISTGCQIICVILLLAGHDGYSQRNPARWFQARVAPLNLLDPRTGVIQVGIEKKLGSHIALSFDYGHKITVISRFSRDSERKDHRYYKTKAEFKYLIRKLDVNLSGQSIPYLSVQGFYFPQRYRKENSWLVKDGASYRYDYSHVTRNATAVSLLVGITQVDKRYIFDFYYGVGIKVLTINHQAVNPVAGVRHEATDWSPTPIDLFEGRFYRLHLPFGFKLGYILN